MIDQLPCNKCSHCVKARWGEEDVLLCVHPKTCEQVSNNKGLRIDEPKEYLKEDGFPDWCPLDAGTIIEVKKMNDYDPERLPHYEFRSRDGDLAVSFPLNRDDIIAIDRAVVFLRTAPDNTRVSMRLGEIDVHITIKPPQAMSPSISEDRP